MTNRTAERDPELDRDGQAQQRQQASPCSCERPSICTTAGVTVTDAETNANVITMTFSNARGHNKRVAARSNPTPHVRSGDMVADLESGDGNMCSIPAQAVGGGRLKCDQAVIYRAPFKKTEDDDGHV